MSAQRIEIASRILAGFAANNAVFAHNPGCGWALVNCKVKDLVGYSLFLADQLIDEGEKIIPDHKANSRIPNQP